MNNEIIDFQPSERFAKVEDYIKEAIAKAQETGQIYKLECNDFVTTVNSKSDAEELLNQYWQFRHDKGIADGSIATATVDMSKMISGN